MIGSGSTEKELSRLEIALLGKWRMDGTRKSSADMFAGDRLQAEKNISELYEVLGQTQPAFQWLPSPAYVTPAKLRQIKGVGAPLKGRIIQRFAAPLRESVLESMDVHLSPQALLQVFDAFGLHPLRLLFRSAYGSHGSPLGFYRTDPHRTPGTERLFTSLVLDWGQPDPGEMTLWQYALYVLNIPFRTKISNTISFVKRLIESAFGFVAFERHCLMIDSPETILFDEQYRLHSDHGPALRFRDGYTEWRFHGVLVPRAVVEAPEAIKPEMILKERNPEVRRIMLERSGAIRHSSTPGESSFARECLGVANWTGQDIALIKMSGANEGSGARSNRGEQFRRLIHLIKSRLSNLGSKAKVWRGRGKRIT